MQDLCMYTMLVVVHYYNTYLSLSIYIYIYRERERERCVCYSGGAGEGAEAEKVCGRPGAGGARGGGGAERPLRWPIIQYDYSTQLLYCNNYYATI